MIYGVKVFLQVQTRCQGLISTATKTFYSIKEMTQRPLSYFYWEEIQIAYNDKTVFFLWDRSFTDLQRPFEADTQRGQFGWC